MKKLLSVLVVVLVAAALWFALAGDDRGTADVHGRAALAQGDSARSADPAAPAPLSEVTGNGAAGPTVTARRAPMSADATRLGDWPDGEPVWVEGRVLFPAATPADDTLQVVALSSELSPADLYRRPNAFLSKEATGVTEGILSTNAVDADGRFRIPFPAGTEEGWLGLGGRFLYLTAVQAVDFSASETQLAPELGAVVHGRIVVPGGSEPSTVFGEERVRLGLDRSEISVVPAIDNEWSFTRIAEIGPDGEFEFVALRTNEEYELSIDADQLAKFSERGIQLSPGEERYVEARLLLGATLRGRVVTEADEPVADAEVTAIEGLVFGFPTGNSARAQTDADGRFELRGVPAGKAKLIASAEGLLRSEVSDFEVVDGDVIEDVTLVLGSGAAIEGTVFYPDGEPAAGATVRVEFDPEARLGPAALNASRGARGRTEANANGRFRVAGLGRGPFELTAYADSPEDPDETRWTTRVRPVSADTVGMELTVEPPAGVRGRVVARNGTAITEFTLTAEQKGMAFAMRNAFGGEDEGWPEERFEQTFEHPDGRFSLTGLVSGPWRLQARAEGFAASAPLELILPADAGDVTIELDPAATVTGTVVDPMGEPIAGAMVTILAQSDRAMSQITGELDLPETRSDATGTFELIGLGPGTKPLVASHPDYASSEPATVETVAGATIPGIVLKLRLGGLITGLVYGTDGTPLAGAHVVAQKGATLSSHIRRTQVDGSFRVERVEPGDWTITAIMNDDALGAGDYGQDGTAAFLENIKFAMVHVVDGEEVSVILGAPPTDPVHVYGVVEHDGKPIRSGILNFVLEGAKGFDAMKIASIAEDGSYSVDLPEPGTFLVSVQILGSSSFQQETIEFRRDIPKGNEFALDFELPLGRISGHITGEDGDSIAGARVTLIMQGGLASGTMLGGQYAEVVTSEGGFYDFKFLRPATYSVAAGGTAFGGAFGTTTTNGRQVHDGVRVGESDHRSGIDFRLTESGDIAGRIVDASGTPVGGASIFVRDARGRLLERMSMITSDPGGGFQYSGVSEGEYSVIARAPGMASAESHVVRVEAGRTARTTITLDPGTTLVVTVIDASGADVASSISVLDAGGREMAGMIGYAEMMARLTDGLRTDQQRIGPLPPGSYTVRVTAEDGRTAKKSVTADGRAERKLKIRLR